MINLCLSIVYVFQFCAYVPRIFSIGSYTFLLFVVLNFRTLTFISIKIVICSPEKVRKFEDFLKNFTSILDYDPWTLLASFRVKKFLSKNLIMKWTFLISKLVFYKVMDNLNKNESYYRKVLAQRLSTLQLMYLPVSYIAFSWLKI